MLSHDHIPPAHAASAACVSASVCGWRLKGENKVLPCDQIPRHPWLGIGRRQLVMLMGMCFDIFLRSGQPWRLAMSSQRALVNALMRRCDEKSTWLCELLLRPPLPPPLWLRCQLRFQS